VDEELPRSSAEIRPRIALEAASQIESLGGIHHWLRPQHDTACPFSLRAPKSIAHQCLTDSTTAHVGSHG